jgi:DNA (cytosine-5)-methyltransferase 1
VTLAYASLCDGIGAAHLAWQPLGWRCAWTSEIDPFACAVVAHHWHLPNLGDMTKITEDRIHGYGQLDLIVGGTPCQSFSVAGLRKGMADPRGNLALVFLRIVDMARPRWVLWENVPGVLSSNKGRDFGSFLGALGECGYGFAYRVLDAQFFGVPQQRRRVFVVGHLGDWRPAAAILLELESLRGNSSPRRKARAAVARSLTSSTGGCSAKEQQYTSIGADGRPLNALCFGGGNTAGEIDVYTCLTHHHTRQDFNTETFVVHALTAEGHDASEDGTGRGTPIIPVAGTLSASGAGTARTGNGNETDLLVVQPRTARAVRRLTPRECERLQGFPDDYTLIQFRGKPAADGPRYRALGNSMAVPVMRWIGRRIAAVDALILGGSRGSC